MPQVGMTRFKDGRFKKKSGANANATIRSTAVAQTTVRVDIASKVSPSITLGTVCGSKPPPTIEVRNNASVLAVHITGKQSYTVCAFAVVFQTVIRSKVDGKIEH